jgi:hypothetical protein
MNDLFGFTYDSATWTGFDIIWPWIGLAAAIIILILLFTTNIFRQSIQVSRWQDALWLSWLAIPIYMIHEFEEYGVDFLGNKHAFPNGLCQNLRLGIYPSCPIPHEFYLYVNIPLVWFFGVIAAMLSRKSPLVGLGLYSVIISNGIVHIAAFVYRQEYNPGLFSAIVIFLPSFFWICKVCFGEKRFSKKGIGVLVGTGIILHVILISSLLAFVNQKISSLTLDLIQVFNASTIIVLNWAGAKLLAVSNKPIS